MKGPVVMFSDLRNVKARGLTGTHMASRLIKAAVFIFKASGVMADGLKGFVQESWSRRKLE